MGVDPFPAEERKKNKVGERAQKQDGTQQASFFACRKILASSCTDPEAMHVPWPNVSKPSIFQTIALMEFVPGNLRQPLCSFRLAPFQRSVCTSHGPGFGSQFFGTILLMKFVLRNPCQQPCFFILAQCQRSYARPIAQGLET